jgi:hydrogenase-4 component B
VSVMFSIFFALCAAGIVAALLVPEPRSPRVLAGTGALASLVLLCAGGQALAAGQPFRMPLWAVPELGMLTLRMDRLSALFVLVTGLVFLPVSIFSAEYLERYLHHYSLRAFSVWYLLLFASIVLVLIAGDILTFLLAWEAMSILSYLLVNFEHEREENTRAGYLMLAMGEAGTLAAAMALLILANAAGSLQFPALKTAAAGLAASGRWAVFLLSFFGFGVKAGLVPFNSWLPRAHPAAPANVSAVLSGVILNLGFYGIARVNLDLLPPALTGPGLVALIVGTISAFVGILYATTQNDLKVLLAYSSIENIGIVTAGLGAGSVLAAAGRPALAAIAFVAAFYHMTNHSLYKALLFLGAGSVDSSAGTRDLDLLGGLIRRMPWTAMFFLVGALSISAMPPFNGFVSEWLTLQTMLRSAELRSTAVKMVFALCGAGLALTAALAVTCFVKAFAMGFLGMSRSPQAEESREVPRSMTAPMGLLAVLCLVLGVLPTYMIPTLDAALMPMSGASAAEALVPPFFAANRAHAQLPPAFVQEFHSLGAQVGAGLVPARGLVVLHRGGPRNPVVFAMSTSYMFPVLLLLLGLTYAVVRLGLSRHRRVARQPCWDGGIRRLLPEMTYTATGFSNPVRVIFDAIIRPTTAADTHETVAQHFRMAIRRQREDTYIVDRLVLRPVRQAAFKIASGLAALHHGRLNAYVAYAFLTLVIVMVVVVALATSR